MQCCPEELLRLLFVLQLMTEAAVAKERAKLYAELKQNMSSHLLAASADEMSTLRDRSPALHFIACLTVWHFQSHHPCYSVH